MAEKSVAKARLSQTLEANPKCKLKARPRITSFFNFYSKLAQEEKKLV
jgi:hypothetical protein